MISPIQFLTWQAISQKVRSSLIDNCTISKSTHPLMSCHHCLDWWRRPLKRIEKITPQFPISFMPIMLLPKILQPWRLSLVKKLWLRKIILIFSSWRGLKKSSFLKVNTSQEVCTIHWTWHGNSCQFILRKAYQRSHQTLSKGTTKRDWTKMRMKKRRNENVICSNLLS